MEKGKLYEVICTRGVSRDICKWVANGIHCTECNHAAYKLRERTVHTEEEKEKEEKDGE